MTTHSFHRRNPLLITDHEYSTSQFESKVSKALKVVQTLLDNTRNPSLASPNHTHTYHDKFTLSESMTNTALTALLNVLEKMGLGGGEGGDKSTTTAAASILQKLTKFVQDDKKSITMRFVAKESCSFIKESEHEFEDPHSIVEETTSNQRGRNNRKTTTRTVKTKVRQYHWNIEIEYGIYLYCGNETLFNAPNSQPIVVNTISCELVTTTSQAPYSSSNETNPMDVSLTWLLQNVNKDTLQAKFCVNREKESCRTPRNNDEVRQAWDFFYNVGDWFAGVGRYFTEKDRSIFQGRKVVEGQLRGKKYLYSIKGNGIFVPVLPIFDPTNTNDTMEMSDTSTSPLIRAEDVNRFLEKQYLTMSEEMKAVASHFSSQPFMASTEATIVLLAKHATSITTYWGDGINHIEDMLCTQLYNAIGKNVTSNDLNDFVRYHNQKIFADSYAPESFCYAVRRDGCFPDGAISIEENMIGGGNGGDNKGNDNKHAMTFTRQLETSNGGYPIMHVPINSATYVQLTGDLFLHAWMLQRFQDKPSFQLVSRARQFSSFLLLIGKLAGPDTFEPEHGIILQNKDELLIPLLLEEMPSAKEFKDAISSLSPEQQRFAKAFRSMKLSSSVFGVCVVQLKPQLELLLNLPEKSLTKEIRLTQDLLSLFIDYQIPSDLLSYDGLNDLDPSSKVEVVKGHVKKVFDMVDEMKDRDLKEAQQKADMKFELDDSDDCDDSDHCFEEMMAKEFEQPREIKMAKKKVALRGGGRSLRSLPQKRLLSESLQQNMMQQQQQQQQQTETTASSNVSVHSNVSSIHYQSEDDHINGSSHTRDGQGESQPMTVTDAKASPLSKECLATKIRNELNSKRNIDRHDDSASIASSELSSGCTHVRLSMFPLYVLEVRENWPESGRARKVVDIDTAIEIMTPRPEFHQVLSEVKQKGYHVKPHHQSPNSRKNNYKLPQSSGAVESASSKESII
mmetsp:Transcript_17663/g.26457  ORF Transcript_17663/g.26457 Transcript_17663/m.26457 type:complete len:962 (-) Transcript_17663:4036-6921(-)